MSADEALNTSENIGCIEVLVLRCAGTRDKSTLTMNLDGASDWSGDPFGLDEKLSRSHKSQTYDDRGPYFKSTRSGSGPPPPLPSYRTSYAESLRSPSGSEQRNHHNSQHVRKSISRVSISHHSQPKSRYSQSVSPHTRRATDLPPSGFQYGSGPIPPDKNDTHYESYSTAVPHKDGVDPVWLNKLLTTAVKQGVEESRRMEQSIHGKDSAYASQKEKSQASAQPSRQSESTSSIRNRSDRGSWKQSQDGCAQSEARSKGTRVSWSMEPVWETETSSSNGWHSSGETPSDSWDTEETWTKNKAQGWEDSSQSAMPIPATPVRLDARSIPLHLSDGQRSKQSSRHQSRSRRSRRDDESSSSEDKGWAHIEQPSDSVISLSSNDTVQPSHHQSTKSLRQTSKGRSRRSKSTHRSRDRTSSRHSHHTAQPTGSQTVHVPAPITLVIPTIVNAPESVPPQVQSRQPSVHGNASASVFPAPSLVVPVQDPVRKQSSTHSIPAPYTSWGTDFLQDPAADKECRSTSSGSWGNEMESGWKKTEFEDEKTSGWEKTDVEGHGKTSGWENTEVQDYGKNGWYSTDEDQNSAWSEPEKDKKPEATGWDIESTTWSEPNKDQKPEATAWDTKSTTWSIKDPPKETKKQSVSMQQVPDLKTALEATPCTKESKAKHRKWENSSWTIQPASDTNTKSKPAMQWDTPDPFTTTTTLLPPYSHSRKHHVKHHTKHHHKQKHQHAHPPPETNPQRPLPPSPSTHQPPNIPPGEKESPSKIVAPKPNLAHHIRTGTPRPYGHAIARPDYIDSLEAPYAVFRFKYRSVGVLERMFGRDEVLGQGVEKDGKGMGSVRSTVTKERKEEKVEKVDSRTEEWVRGQSAVLV